MTTVDDDSKPISHGSTKQSLRIAQEMNDEAQQQSSSTLFSENLMECYNNHHSQPLSTTPLFSRDISFGSLMNDLSFDSSVRDYALPSIVKTESLKTFKSSYASILSSSNRVEDAPRHTKDQTSLPELVMYTTRTSTFDDGRKREENSIAIGFDMSPTDLASTSCTMLSSPTQIQGGYIQRKRQFEPIPLNNYDCEYKPQENMHLSHFPHSNQEYCHRSNQYIYPSKLPDHFDYISSSSSSGHESYMKSTKVRGVSSRGSRRPNHFKDSFKPLERVSCAEVHRNDISGNGSIKFEYPSFHFGPPSKKAYIASPISTIAKKSANIAHNLSEDKKDETQFCSPLNAPGCFGSNIRPSNAFCVLSSVSDLFRGLKYRLPFVLEAMASKSVHSCEDNDIKLIAKKIGIRRVESAVIFFGGHLKSDRFTIRVPKSLNSDALLVSTPIRNQHEYINNHPSHFQMQQAQLSWDFEDDQQITVRDHAGSYRALEEKPNDGNRSDLHQLTMPSNGNRCTKIDAEKVHNTAASDSTCSKEKSSSVSSLSTSKVCPKTKYRCRYCGQLKQKHNCPLQQNLHRSIGVMVYSALNAYTAAEPGDLAQPLEEMNNFMGYDSLSYEHETSQKSPTLPLMKAGFMAIKQSEYVATVTPDPMCRKSDPQSSTASPSKKNGNASMFERKDMAKAEMAGVSSSVFSSRKLKVNKNKNDCDSHQSEEGGTHAFSSLRSHVDSGGSLLGDNKRDSLLRSAGNYCSPAKFIEATPLRPEQFRSVTKEINGRQNFGKYEYAPASVTFSSRKRVSDTLFCLLRNDVPEMMEDCASVLRQVDFDMACTSTTEWDLAIAELLTQILVGLKCQEYDFRLDGLANYLGRVGIAC